MAQRISRAKRTVRDVRFEEPGDLATVLRVLYLVFNEGYTGDVDLATEAIRLTRQLASMTDDEETAGLLALMLLHHARRPARTRRDGSLVPLTEQDRSRWNTSLIAEGVAVLQTALGRDRLGEFQAQAAIAALHADAARAEETDWAAPAHREPGRAAQPSHRDRRGRWPRGRPRGLGHGGPWPAPPPRRLGVPPRESGRHSDRGTVVCRCRPVRPQPRRTPPPHPAGSADQSSAACVSLLANHSHKANADRSCGESRVTDTPRNCSAPVSSAEGRAHAARSTACQAQVSEVETNSSPTTPERSGVATTVRTRVAKPGRKWSPRPGKRQSHRGDLPVKSRTALPARRTAPPQFDT